MGPGLRGKWSFIANKVLEKFRAKHDLGYFKQFSC